jgi:hypothetical protein
MNNNTLDKIDIVHLIEKNPLTRLNSSYQNKLINKIKTQFTDTQQQLFISSFYCYLKYNSKTDFIIDLDDIWKWCGFSRKGFAKTLLEKHFVKDIDYKIALPCQEQLLQTQKQVYKNLGGSGLNKEQILMNVTTFKKFCMKARTKKADEIHEYYIKLEELLQETIEEESEELRNQLLIKEEKIQNNEIDKYILKEKTLLEQNPKNTLCIYYGNVDDKSLTNESLIKFGRTNDLAARIKCHKSSYTNFRLVQVFKVSNHIEIENLIKAHETLKRRRRSIKIKEKCYTELLATNEEEFNLDKINEHIKQIIQENEYNLGNYKILLDKNSKLNTENYNLIEENKKLTHEMNKIIKKYKPDEYDKKSKQISNVSNNAYTMYAFKIKDTRYRCGVWRYNKLDELAINLKNEFKDGSMVHNVKISNYIMEKFMLFIMKNKLTLVGNNTFDGSCEDIKTIINICSRLENIITKNDIHTILNNLTNFNNLSK